VGTTGVDATSAGTSNSNNIPTENADICSNNNIPTDSVSSGNLSSQNIATTNDEPTDATDATAVQKTSTITACKIS